MAYFGAFDRGNPASSNYYKDPLSEMYARTNTLKQNYFQGLQDRAQSVKALESAAMTSPEYQLQKYIWQSNEEMMPMQPWQMYAGQQQMPQQTTGGGVLSGTMAPVSTVSQQVQPTSYTLSGNQMETTPTTESSYYTGGSYYQPTAINQNLLSGGLW